MLLLIIIIIIISLQFSTQLIYTTELLQVLVLCRLHPLGLICIPIFEYYIATNSMKPPAFDIGYGVYRSFYFTEYVPPPAPKKCQTSKKPNEIMDDEEPSN